jgi:hypothetical protein
MTIFLPHIYSPVKYEARQGRKNFAVVRRLFAVVRRLYCTYHRELSWRGDVVSVVFCRGKGGRPGGSPASRPRARREAAYACGGQLLVAPIRGVGRGVGAIGTPPDASSSALAIRASSLARLRQ